MAAVNRNVVGSSPACGAIHLPREHDEGERFDRAPRDLSRGFVFPASALSRLA
jgi:hypothetical protein